jgi:hypothetical protein
MGQARFRNSNVSTLGGTAERKSFRKTACRQACSVGITTLLRKTAPGFRNPETVWPLKNQDDVSWAGSATATLRPRVTGFFQ